MTKEEARAMLRRKQSELRQAEIVIGMHENGIREIKEDISKLEAIINKKDDWRDELVQPDTTVFYFIEKDKNQGFVVEEGYFSPRKPEHAFRTQEQAELIKEKMLLMQEMHAFASVRNEGWMPDWGNGEQGKYGVVHRGDGITAEIATAWFTYVNSFVFGVSVKSWEIAEEMLKEFGERIEKFYNKMY